MRIIFGKSTPKRIKYQNNCHILLFFYFFRFLNIHVWPLFLQNMNQEITCELRTLISKTNANWLEVFLVHEEMSNSCYWWFQMHQVFLIFILQAKLWWIRWNILLPLHQCPPMSCRSGSGGISLLPDHCNKIHPNLNLTGKKSKFSWKISIKDPDQAFSMQRQVVVIIAMSQSLLQLQTPVPYLLYPKFSPQYSATIDEQRYTALHKNRAYNKEHVHWCQRNQGPLRSNTQLSRLKLKFLVFTLSQCGLKTFDSSLKSRNL